MERVRELDVDGELEKHLLQLQRHSEVLEVHLQTLNANVAKRFHLPVAVYPQGKGGGLAAVQKVEADVHNSFMCLKCHKHAVEHGSEGLVCTRECPWSACKPPINGGGLVNMCVTSAGSWVSRAHCCVLAQLAY